jgi:hypothetical protein
LYIELGFSGEATGDGKFIIALQTSLCYNLNMEFVGFARNVKSG